MGVESKNVSGAEDFAPDAAEVIEQRLARAQSRRVMIGTPVARHPLRQYTISLLDTSMLLRNYGIYFTVHWVVGNSNLARARNEIVAAFLASDCTDLLWIDDDMGWNGSDVIRLLASDKDIIGGVGRKKTKSPDTDRNTWCCRWLPGTDIVQDDMGAVQMAGIGTGFVKMSRHVFETIIAAHPNLKRPGLDTQTGLERENFYRFFHFLDDEEGRMMSEDIAFCGLWRSLGGTVWADPGIELVHVGEQEFTGTIAGLMVPETGRAE